MVLVERFLSFMSSIIRRRSGVMTCSCVEVTEGGAFIMAGRIVEGRSGAGDESPVALRSLVPDGMKQSVGRGLRQATTL